MIRLRTEHARAGAAAPRLRRSARRFLAALGRPGAELSLLLCGDAAIRRLNREWRGVDRPTDVLSFPAATPPAGGGAALLGDVVISLDTAARAARAAGEPLARELDRYLAHGILHLLGHDHERPAEARRMAAAEEGLLRGEGMIGRAGSGSRSRSGSGSGLRSRSGSGLRSRSR